MRAHPQTCGPASEKLGGLAPSHNPRREVHGGRAREPYICWPCVGEAGYFYPRPNSWVKDARAQEPALGLGCGARRNSSSIAATVGETCLVLTSPANAANHSRNRPMVASTLCIRSAKCTGSKSSA